MCIRCTFAKIFIGIVIIGQALLLTQRLIIGGAITDI